MRVLSPLHTPFLFERRNGNLDVLLSGLHFSFDPSHGSCCTHQPGLWARQSLITVNHQAPSAATFFMSSVSWQICVWSCPGETVQGFGRLLGTGAQRTVKIISIHAVIELGWISLHTEKRSASSPTKITGYCTVHTKIRPVVIFTQVGKIGPPPWCLVTRIVVHEPEKRK